MSDLDSDLWLVTDFGPTTDSHEVNAVWVHADSAEAAAEEGLTVLEAEHDYGTRLDTVAVVRAADRQFYSIGPRATLAGLQCCGGADTGDGHSGFCALHDSAGIG